MNASDKFGCCVTQENFCFCRSWFFPLIPLCWVTQENFSKVQGLKASPSSCLLLAILAGNAGRQCQQAMSAGNACSTHGYKINKIRLYALFHSDYGWHAGIQAVFLLPMPTNCLILSILRAGKWKSGLYTHERWQLGSGKGFLKENERNKPMEGKRVLCWIAIKKEKMVIKYIMGHRGK